jgi:hypothetical protein
MQHNYVSRKRLRLLLTTAAITVCGTVSSQAQTASNTTVLDTVSNVIVSYNVGTCQGQTLLFLKVENNNAASKDVTYTLFGEAPRTISIPANTVLQGGCNPPQPALNGLIPTGLSLANLSPVINVN